MRGNIIKCPLSPKADEYNVHLPITGFSSRFFFFPLAGVESERSASAHNKDRRLLDDVPDSDSCLGRSYQVTAVLPISLGNDSRAQCVTSSPLLRRLFQVIVRIDDCLALLNLVSISETASRALARHRFMMAVSLY